MSQVYLTKKNLIIAVAAIAVVSLALTLPSGDRKQDKEATMVSEDVIETKDVKETSDASTPASASAVKDAIAKGAIKVICATYGSNCSKKSVKGNVTDHLKSTCDGKKTCEYKVEVNKIGDPFYGCPKTYVAEYSCSGKKLQA